MEDIKQEPWVNCLLPLPDGNAGSSKLRYRQKEKKTCRNKTAERQEVGREGGVAFGYADIIHPGTLLCCKDQIQYNRI
jgi:hypothetical protein